MKFADSPFVVFRGQEVIDRVSVHVEGEMVPLGRGVGICLARPRNT